MKQQATSAMFWAGMFGVICILTLSAPFSTDKQFNVIQLFFYWGGIAVSTYFLGIFVLLSLLRKLMQSGKTELFARVVASIVSALAIAALVFFINSVVVGIDEFHWKAFLSLGINCFFISLAISIIFFIVNDTLENAKHLKLMTRNHPAVLKG